MKTHGFAWRCAAALAGPLACLPAAAQPAGPVDAYAPISTSGFYLETSPGQLAFIGLATGVMIVESDVGLVNSGDISCTVTMDIAAQTRKFDAMGRCKVLGTQGKTLYGGYQCIGELAFGCRGTFTVTGGTDEFAGATGSADFLLRTLISESILAPGSGVSSNVTDGVAIWRGLDIVLARTETGGSPTAEEGEEGDEDDEDGEADADSDIN